MPASTSQALAPTSSTPASTSHPSAPQAPQTRPPHMTVVPGSSLSQGQEVGGGFEVTIIANESVLHRWSCGSLSPLGTGASTLPMPTGASVYYGFAGVSESIGDSFGSTRELSNGLLKVVISFNGQVVHQWSCRAGLVPAPPESVLPRPPASTLVGQPHGGIAEPMNAPSSDSRGGDTSRPSNEPSGDSPFESSSRPTNTTSVARRPTNPPQPTNRGSQLHRDATQPTGGRSVPSRTDVSKPTRGPAEHSRESSQPGINYNARALLDVLKLPDADGRTAGNLPTGTEKDGSTRFKPTGAEKKPPDRSQPIKPKDYVPPHLRVPPPSQSQAPTTSQSQAVPPHPRHQAPPPSQSRAAPPSQHPAPPTSQSQAVPPHLRHQAPPPDQSRTPLPYSQPQAPTASQTQAPTTSLPQAPPPSQSTSTPAETSGPNQNSSSPPTVTTADRSLELADPSQFGNGDLRFKISRSTESKSAYLLLPVVIDYLKNRRIHVEKRQNKCCYCVEEDEDVDPNQKLYVVLTCCGNWAHRDCLIKWESRPEANCAVCRALYDGEDKTPKLRKER
ncbi:hypothetical protein MMC10_000564, partial [Thelotrema lepadinum]|nr:hypothetical protein [Thelotrema lepadinum]